MKDVATGGRTILFVSHNMLTISKLCNSAILLKNGKINSIGPTEKIIKNYNSNNDQKSFSTKCTYDKPQIVSVRIHKNTSTIDNEVKIEVSYWLPQRTEGVKVGIGLNTVEGQRIFDACPEDLGLTSPNTQGFNKATITIKENQLAAKTFLISTGIWKNEKSLDHVQELFFSPNAANIKRYKHEKNYDGYVILECKWKL